MFFIQTYRVHLANKSNTLSPVDESNKNTVILSCLGYEFAMFDHYNPKSCLVKENGVTSLRSNTATWQICDMDHN